MCSSDLASHAIHLRKVLELLREHDLRVKYSKCHFCESEVRFLGHVINQDGIGVDSEKVRAVGEWKRPEVISMIWRFVEFDWCSKCESSFLEWKRG